MLVVACDAKHGASAMIKVYMKLPRIGHPRHPTARSHSMSSRKTTQHSPKLNLNPNLNPNPQRTSDLKLLLGTMRRKPSLSRLTPLRERKVDYVHLNIERSKRHASCKNVKTTKEEQQVANGSPKVNDFLQMKTLYLKEYRSLRSKKL